jgi:hypothetical protein
MVGSRRKARKANWNDETKKLRALSVRQPWAWLIVNGYKNVENRSRATRHRGPLLIQAGLSRANLEEAVLSRIERKYGVKLPREFELGGVIGIVDVVDCVRRSSSPWHERGSMGWRLRNPRRLPFRRCKGALGFFKPQLLR